MAAGFAIGASTSLAILLSIGYFILNWKSLAWTVLVWTIGAGIGWYIARRVLIDNLSLDYAISWAIGTAIGWGIGGFATGWLLLKDMGKPEQ